MRPLKQNVIGNVGSVLWLWVVMGTIGVVLLIACANVTNLLRDRSSDIYPGNIDPAFTPGYK